MRRVGVLTGGTSDDPETKSLLAVFQRTLQERGWIEGRTIQFEYRFAGDDADLRQIYAVELAAKAPDVEGEHPKIDPHFVTGRDVSAAADWSVDAEITGAEGVRFSGVHRKTFAHFEVFGF